MCLAVVIKCVTVPSSKVTVALYIPPFSLMRAAMVAFSMRKTC